MNRAFHTALLTLLLVALPFAACGGTSGEAPAAAGESDGAGASETGFRLTTLDGEELGPPDYADHVVLVDFWATWCVPCHAQAEILKEVWAGLEDDDRVQFLAVDVGETETQVRGFVANNPFPYPVLLDPRSETADSLRVYSLPTLMILDRQGEVSYFEPGVLGKDQLCEELQTAGATEVC